MKHLLIAIALLLCGCGDKKPAPADPFQPVEIPVIYTGVDSLGVDLRTAWLAEHYWDKANLADTSWLSRKEQLSRRTMDFINVLMGVDKARANRAVVNFLDASSTSKEQFLLSAEVLEDMLYDPNSPLRSEGLYVAVLERVIASPLLDPIDKIRPESQLVMAAKNNPGEPATDLLYTLPNGKTGRLSAIDAPFILLYFYNPDCSGCEEMTEAIKANPTITQAVSTGEMAVLALYVDGDEQLWRDHFGVMGENWIVARDAGEVVKEQQLYDLKAIPTIYLIDWQKNVLLKDVTVGQLNDYLNYLMQLQQQAQQGMF